MMYFASIIITIVRADSKKKIKKIKHKKVQR